MTCNFCSNCMPKLKRQGSLFTREAGTKGGSSSSQSPEGTGVGGVLKTRAIRESEKHSSTGQPQLSTISRFNSSRESLGAECGLPNPRALHTEPSPLHHKDLGKRRGDFFLHFQVTTFSVAEASLQRKLLLSEPYLPSGKPIRYFQPPLVSCLTEEKKNGLKCISKLQSRDSGPLKYITPHKRDLITR